MESAVSLEATDEDASNDINRRKNADILLNGESDFKYCQNGNISITTQSEFREYPNEGTFELHDGNSCQSQEFDDEPCLAGNITELCHVMARDRETMDSIPESEMNLVFGQRNGHQELSPPSVEQPLLITLSEEEASRASINTNDTLLPDDINDRAPTSETRAANIITSTLPDALSSNVSLEMNYNNIVLGDRLETSFVEDADIAQLGISSKVEVKVEPVTFPLYSLPTAMSHFDQVDGLDIVYQSSSESSPQKLKTDTGTILKELRISLTRCSVPSADSCDIKADDTLVMENCAEWVVKSEPRPFKISSLVSIAEVKLKELVIKLDRCDNGEVWEYVVDEAIEEPTLPDSFVPGINMKHLCCMKCNYTGMDSQDLFKHMKRHYGPKVFHCTDCDYRTSENTIVIRHYKLKHTRYKPFKCAECPSRFLLRWQLDSHHMFSHTDIRPFQCKVCPKKFISQGKLNGHMKYHSSVKPFQCPHCSYSALLKGSLVTHVNCIHKKERNFACPYCEFRSSTKARMSYHKETHEDGKRYACSTCSFRTLSRTSLRDHTNAHNNIRPFKCEHCEKAFVRYADRRKHLTTHTLEKPFQCHLCDYAGSRRTHLQKHIEHKHKAKEDRKQYLCPICQQTHMCKYALKKHVDAHNGILKPRKHVCNVCPRAFTNVTALRSHMTLHTGKRDFKCPICEFATRTASLLSSHMKIHSDVKPLECPFCDYKSAHTWAIRSHIKTHEVNGSYPCQHCDRMFRSSGAVKYHTQRVHEGQPVRHRHTCNQCEFKSYSKAMLTEHMMKHAGEKPLKCHICDFATRRQWTLDQHTLRHSNKK